MGRTTIRISVDKKVLLDIDFLIRKRAITSRSQLFEVAIKQWLDRMHRSRLARESAKLDKAEEQALTNESYFADVVAPEY